VSSNGRDRVSIRLVLVIIWLILVAGSVMACGSATSSAGGSAGGSAGSSAGSGTGSAGGEDNDYDYAIPGEDDGTGSGAGGAAGGGTGSAGGAAGEPGGTRDPQLSQYLENCRSKIQNWREAKVDYPAPVTVQLDNAYSYVAAIDIRSNPEPASDVLNAPSAQADSAAVRCEVSARLVSTDPRMVAINPQEWQRREFTPAGVANWAWTVVPSREGDSDLRLELQPALKNESGENLDDSESAAITATYLTHLRVDPRPPPPPPPPPPLTDRVQEGWGYAVLAAGALSVAIIASIKFGGDIGQALREARSKWRGSPVRPGMSADTKETDSHPSDKSPP
jgi:hypothetical protein